ncbi:MAG: DsbA family protein [Rhodoferax sp.]
MSLKSLLMPAISQRLLSRQRLLQGRRRAEQARVSQGRPHEVHYFHQIDDPYSALAGACLPQLLQRYDITLTPHVVGPPPDNAAPERGQLIAYSRKDAALLARRFGLTFTDQHRQPAEGPIELASQMLVAAIEAGRFSEVAAPVAAGLWSIGEAIPNVGLTPASIELTAAHIARSNALRRRLGHYLGATFYYAGEWYWGVDRLHHLEQRLQDLGAQRPGTLGCLFPPGEDLAAPVQIDKPPPIDFFVSLRSPYSAIVTPRVFELGRLTGAEVRLRYVLPMVMRGLPVPREKRAYIAQDTAREAHMRGTPFGRLNDPVGRPTERGIALLAAAGRMGLGEAFLRAFMHGVWAEGIDAGSSRGLRTIAVRAGLDWPTAQKALADDSWRVVAERNREDMFALGLWGVPSFHVGDTVVWGQDRLWAAQDGLLKGKR